MTLIVSRNEPRSYFEETAHPDLLENLLALE